MKLPTFSRQRKQDEARLAQLREALARMIENDLLTPVHIRLENGKGARKIRAEIREIEKRLYGTQEKGK